MPGTLQWMTAVAISAALTLGCSESETYETAGSTEPAVAAERAIPAAVSDPERVAAVLAAADVVDGTEDHVVARCAGCALHMDGSAEHAIEVGDYELRFCSTGCRDAFSVETEAKLVAMELPEE